MKTERAKKHPEFVGNLKAVEARDFWCDAAVSPNAMQGSNMEVGNALGWAMTELLNSGKSKPLHIAAAECKP